jgi:hypothetical protein
LLEGKVLVEETDPNFNNNNNNNNASSYIVSCVCMLFISDATPACFAIFTQAPRNFKEKDPGRANLSPKLKSLFFFRKFPYVLWSLSDGIKHAHAWIHWMFDVCEKEKKCAHLSANRRHPWSVDGIVYGVGVSHAGFWV